MDNNKEYIINIRVSKDTYNKLKQRAKENSESLSSLVRKTLDDSWEILEDIRSDIFGKGDKTANGVDYYQKVIIARDVYCSRCEAVLVRGSQAFLAETKTGSKKYFCNECFTNS